MCNCKCHFHKVTTATTNGTNVTLGFASPVTATNKDKFGFVICTALPSTPTPEPVQITVNGVGVPLVNMFGNPVYSNEIRSRRPSYFGYFGSQATPHVIIHNLGNPCCG